MRKIIKFLMLVFLFTNYLNAQEPKARSVQTTPKEEKAKVKTIDEDTISPKAKKIDIDNIKRKEAKNEIVASKTSNPAIRLLAGQSSANIKDVNLDSGMLTSVTLEMGYLKRLPLTCSFFTRSEKHNEFQTKLKNVNVEEVSFYNLFFNYQFGNQSNCDAHYLKAAYLLGGSSLEGGSYKTGNIALLNGSGTFWTDLNFENPTSVTSRFADGVRIGTKYASDIMLLKLGDMVSLNIGASRYVVYERYLFWKHTGSSLLKSLADLSLDMFIEEIKDASPYAYPVVNFLLKTALDYGFSELQRNKMNWPFATAPAFISDEFRVGLSFEF